VKRVFWYYFGWVIIRPLRKLSHWTAKGSFGLRILPKKSFWGWQLPNIHYWILYKTLGKFFLWLKWDGWRPFCDWTGGYRRSYPLIARIIHKIGTTMSWGFHGGECYHCANEEGDQVNLADDDTGTTFKLLEAWDSATENGTDHRFKGITICPYCGYEDEYEDGSL